MTVGLPEQDAARLAQHHQLGELLKYQMKRYKNIPKDQEKGHHF
jgi:hypothetical protein